MAWFLKILKVTDNIRNVIEKSIEILKVELTSGGEILDELKINRDIFQGDSLSPILFVITLYMDTLSILLRDMKAGYTSRDFRGKLITYSFMDDLKLSLDDLVTGVFSANSKNFQ